MVTNRELWENAAKAYECHGYLAAADMARTPFSDLRRFGDPEMIVIKLGKLPGIIDNKYPAYIRKTKIHFKESRND